MVFGQPGQINPVGRKEDGRRRSFFLSSGCPLGLLVVGQPGKIGLRLEGSWPVCTWDAHLWRLACKHQEQWQKLCRISPLRHSQWQPIFVLASGEGEPRSISMSGERGGLPDVPSVATLAPLRFQVRSFQTCTACWMLCVVSGVGDLLSTLAVLIAVRESTFPPSSTCRCALELCTPAINAPTFWMILDP